MFYEYTFKHLLVCHAFLAMNKLKLLLSHKSSFCRLRHNKSYQHMPKHELAAITTTVSYPFPLAVASMKTNRNTCQGLGPS